LATAFRFSVGDRVMSMADAASGTDGDLLHVHARPRIEHLSALAGGDHGQGVAPSERRERRPVYGIDGDVRFGRLTRANAFAVVKHRRFVLLAFSDHHDAVHRHGREDESHGVDGRAIGRFFVASTHPTGGGHGGRFGHPDELHGQVAVGRLSVVRHGHALEPSRSVRAAQRSSEGLKAGHLI
jgi:hypothetical protein